MALTKSQIVDEVHERALGFNSSRNKSVETVEILLEIIKRTLENGEDLLISGFGKFCVTEKNERKGRNPATGESLMLKRRKIVTFKCSGKLRDKVNGREKKWYDQR